MDIQELAVGMAQQRVQEQAAVQVQSMALEEARDQSAALAKLMESATQVIADPSLASKVDLLG